MMMIKVFKFGEVKELTNETECYVGRCGSGHTVFGEPAKLHKILSKHLVFITKSGTLVKTDMNMNTVGKAANNGYWVGFGDRSDNPNYINMRVSYWNDKKVCFEYK